ncbi:hypothetical protein E2N92_03155 [Methanofollis formosanus]|uniref:Uncharacterized protein n=1 Tax=Methanofollis formosanus TaxID=299308 RepID=A0A8G1EG31_9EURY|nr:hypothetical protein [Methanofollis formosanus]QYZ78497.1 hypothetical protein E2N92_03155 [Methanofollis formosanus]
MKQNFLYNSSPWAIATALLLMVALCVIPVSAADWPVNLCRLNDDNTWTNTTIDNSTFIGLTQTDPATFTDPKKREWSGTTLERLIGYFDDDTTSTFNEFIAEGNYTIKVVGKNKNVARTSTFYSSELLDAENSSAFVVADKLDDEYLSPDGYPDPKITWRYYYPLKLHGYGCSSTDRSVEEITDFIIDLYNV